MRLPLCVNKQVQRLQHTMEATNFYVYLFTFFVCATTRTAHKKRQVRSEN
jgi:hypothetical protein